MHRLHNKIFRRYIFKKNLDDRIRHRWKYISENGGKFNGIRPDLDATKPPHWYDQRAFKHAQILYGKYRVIIDFTSMLGLLLGLMVDDDILKILLSTGNSKTVDKLFKRYLSTGRHLECWYRYDPFDENSEAFKSLKMVRTMHRNVANKLNENRKPFTDLCMNQREMFMTQFAFFGLSTIIPEKLGYHHHFNRDDYHAIFHFWRTIGYCLGISDEFNLYDSDDYDETIAMCHFIYFEHCLPRIQRCAERYPISRAIQDSFSKLEFSFNYTSIMHYVAPSLSLNTKLYELRTFKDYFDYFALKISIEILFKHEIFIKLCNRIVEIVARNARKNYQTIMKKLRKQYPNIYFTLDTFPFLSK